MADNASTHIVGDVKSVSVKVVKGGHLAAEIKPLAKGVTVRNDRLEGAALQFASGAPVVLLSGHDSGGEALSVKRAGANRYVIAREGPKDVKVDSVEAAFLRLKIEQFASGELNLSSAMTAKTWGGLARERAEPAIQAMKKARRRFARS